MFHDPRLFEALESSRPAKRTRIGPARPAIAPLTMAALGMLSLGMWAGVAYAARLI